MRFISIYRPGSDSAAPPDPQKMQALNELVTEGFGSGVLVATDGLLPSAAGARVRISGGRFTVTDGPFAETKEVIGGYAIMNVGSKAEAVSWTKRFLQIMGEGDCEVRQMYDGEPDKCTEKNAARASADAGR